MTDSPGYRPAQSDDQPTESETGRPGPDLLYSSPQPSPQLQTTAGWDADPLLVSGEDGYVDGEYLYQDYVYDDNGATTTDDPDPHWPKPYNGAKPPTGNVVYPTDFETYGNNAADLLEFRARPVPEGVAYRITLQTMKQPDAAAVAIGIDAGESGGRSDWEFGIGELGELDLDYVLVTWGEGAELLEGDGTRTSLQSSVDLERNQIETTLPVDPGRDTWRHYAVVGLWDEEAHEFEQIADEPTERRPGGAAGESPPPVFNVAFRFDEPLVAAAGEPDVGTPATVPESRESEVRDDGHDSDDGPDRDDDGHYRGDYGHYREHAQANALAARDISELCAEIDFAKLRDGVTDVETPDSGLHSRLYASQFDLGEGISSEERDHTGSQSSTVDVLRNRVQPYSLYVPENYDPEARNPLHLHLHGGGSAYTSVNKAQYLQELGEQRDAIVAVPEARSTNLCYHDEAVLDVVEVLSDVFSRYAVDTRRITVSGASMGGFGTLRLASLYPDLFAKAFAVVADADLPLLDNLLHVPVLLWSGYADEIVPPARYNPASERLRELGYRHELNEFVGFGHGTFTLVDEWGPARHFFESDYLGEPRAVVNPPRVVYRRVPAYDTPKLDLVHDGAYWVDDVSVPRDADDGRVDIQQLNRAPLPANPTKYTDSGDFPGLHTTRGTRWESRIADSAPRNGFDVTLEDVTGLTVFVDETSVDPEQPITLEVETNCETTVTLQSAVGTRKAVFEAGTASESVELDDAGESGS